MSNFNGVDGITVPQEAIETSEKFSFNQMMKSQLEDFEDVNFGELEIEETVAN